jgi:hypothetical protein
LFVLKKILTKAVDAVDIYIRSLHFVSNVCTFSTELNNFYMTFVDEGPGSSVGIAIGYGLDGPGDRIPVGVRFFALGPTQPPVQWVPVESGRGVTLTPHHLLVPRSKNEVELYLYSP